MLFGVQILIKAQMHSRVETTQLHYMNGDLLPNREMLEHNIIRVCCTKMDMASYKIIFMLIFGQVLLHLMGIGMEQKQEIGFQGE